MTSNDPCAEDQAIGSVVDTATATTTSVCPEAEDAVSLRPLTIQNLQEVKDLADKARAEASRARADNFPQIATAAAELEIKALRLLVEMLMLVKFNRFETNDEASVVTNDELLAFIERPTARLLKFLPDNHVAAVRQGAFKLGLGVAVKSRLASSSAKNLARNVPVRAQNKARKKEIVRRECEAFRATRANSRLSAWHIAKERTPKINEALKLAGFKPYTEQTLVSKIREIDRESRPVVLRRLVERVHRTR